MSHHTLPQTSLVHVWAEALSQFLGSWTRPISPTLRPNKILPTLPPGMCSATLTFLFFRCAKAKLISTADPQGTCCSPERNCPLISTCSSPTLFGLQHTCPPTAPSYLHCGGWNGVSIKLCKRTTGHSGLPSCHVPFRAFCPRATQQHNHFCWVPIPRCLQGVLPEPSFTLHPLKATARRCSFMELSFLSKSGTPSAPPKKKPLSLGAALPDPLPQALWIRLSGLVHVNGVPCGCRLPCPCWPLHSAPCFSCPPCSGAMPIFSVSFQF